MKILAIRTDKPEAELGLFEDAKKLQYLKWDADRKLAETLNAKIDSLLADTGIKYQDLDGIVFFKGPGSFTGLRIGLSVANALAYGLSLPVVAESGEDWTDKGIDRLQKGDNEKIASVFYGQEANITLPKK